MENLRIAPDFLDSKEEIYFSWWLEELYNKGVIISATNRTESLKLTEGCIRNYIKPMKRVADKKLTQNILPSRVYTPDFKIVWNTTHPKIELFIGNIKDVHKKWDSLFHPWIEQFETSSFVETKGTFDRNNMTRLFKQNQSWVYANYGIVVSLIKIPNLFNKTFTPKRYMTTDLTQKPRTIKYKNIITIDEFLKN